MMIKWGVWVCNCSRDAHWKRREKSGAVVLLICDFQDVLIFSQIRRLTLYLAACAHSSPYFSFLQSFKRLFVAGGWFILTFANAEHSLARVYFMLCPFLSRRMHRKSQGGSKCMVMCSDPPGRACCCRSSWDRARRSSS